MISKCAFCSKTYEGKRSANARDSHLFRNHWAVAVEDGTNQEILGTCTRELPTSDLRCFIADCTFSIGSHAKMTKHFRDQHDKIVRLKRLGPAAEEDPTDDEDEDQSQNRSPDDGSTQAMDVGEDEQVPFNAAAPTPTHPQSPSQIHIPEGPVITSTPKSTSPLKNIAFPPKDVERSTTSPNAPLKVDDQVVPVELLQRAHFKFIEIPSSNPDKSTYILSCTECEIGLSTGRASQHKKEKHPSTAMEAGEISEIKQFLQSVKVPNSNSEVPTQARGGPPIAGLRVHQDAYECELCQLISSTEASFITHWRTDHQGETRSWRMFHKRVAAQTYFQNHARYFAVQPALSNLSEDDPYAVYLKQLAPDVDTGGAIPTKLDGHDISLLEREMGWRDHLADHIGDKQSVAEIRAYMKLPTNTHGEKHLGDPLRDLVEEYLARTKTLASKVQIAPKKLLMNCPGHPSDTEWWRPVTPTVLLEYGRHLRRFVHAIALGAKPDSRYSFPLTPGDVERLDALLVVLRAHDTSKKAVKCLHTFLKSFLLANENSEIQDYDDFDKWKEVLECYLALDNLREDGNFSSAHEFTKPLSIWEYHTRAAMLYEAHLIKKDFKNNMYRAVEAVALPNLEPGAFSPLNSLMQYQGMASGMSKTSDSPPTTRVSDDGMSISHADRTLHVVELRAGVARLGTELEEMLKSLTYGISETLEVPADIPDDWRDTRRGESWMKNGHWVDDELCVLGRMLQDESLGLSRMNGGKIELSKAKAWDILAQCEQFLKMLAVYAFLTAGQTPRGTEFIEYRIANGARARNLFFSFGVLWMVVRRTKNETRLKREFFIPMKCSVLLTKLMFLYLVLIRPLECHLIFHLRGRDALQTYSEYLFVRNGERMVKEDMYRFFPETMSKYCRFDGGLRDYRQISVEMGRVFLGMEVDLHEDEDDVIARQTGHSVKVARGRYAVEFGHLPSMSSDTMRRFGDASESWWQMMGCHPRKATLLPLDIRRAIASGLGVGGSSANENAKSTGVGSLDEDRIVQRVVKQVVVQVTSKMSDEIQQLNSRVRDVIRETLAEVVAQGLLGGRGGREEPVRQRSAASRGPIDPPLQDRGRTQYRSSPLRGRMDSVERMPASSSKNASVDKTVANEIEGVRGRTVLARRDEADESAEETRGVWTGSRAVWLATQSTSEISNTFLSAPPMFPTELVDEVDEMLGGITIKNHNYMMMLLRQHFPQGGPNLAFKSVGQEQAAFMAVEGNQNFVAVLPTGGGKSLCFTLPPFNEEGFYTYVMIPNKVLLRDQLRKAEEAGVECYHWTAARPIIPEKARLVFFALESITSATLKSMWSIYEPKLRRVVLDEAHLAVGNGLKERPFDKLKDLGRMNVQKIALTASLPLRMEHKFLDQVGMVKETLIVRSSSVQTQICYQLRSVRESSDMLRIGHWLALAMNEVMADDQIGIIFVKSRTNVTELSKRLNGSGSHGGIDEHERKEDEDLWRSGKRRWMVSTTSMIQGIDVPNIGAVIFLEIPYGLLNLYQGAGRGGRDGRTSYAIIVHKPSKKDRSTDFGDDWEFMGEALNWVVSDECRRIGLCQAMDGSSTSCLQVPGAELCDVCEPNSLVRKVLGHALGGRNVVEEVRKLVRGWKGKGKTNSNANSNANTNANSNANANANSNTNPKPKPKTMIELDDDDDEFSGLYEDFDLSELDKIAELGPVAKEDLDAKEEGMSVDDASSIGYPATPGLTVGSATPSRMSSPDFYQRDCGVVIDVGEQLRAALYAGGRELEQVRANSASMSVLHDAGFFKTGAARKRENAKTLQEMYDLFNGNCVVCWIFRGSQCKRHGDRLWVGCKGSGGYAHLGWIDLKRKLNPPTTLLYEICTSCQLPQGLYLPLGHPEVGRRPRGANRYTCPCDDMVALLLWYIQHEAEMWEAASKVFPGLMNVVTTADYGDWCRQGEGFDRFNNGIELTMWGFRKIRDDHLTP